MARSLALLALLALLSGCARPAPEQPNVAVGPTPTPPDDGTPPPATPKFPSESLNRGVAFLLKQQSPDGAWRSDIYATFKDGTALTPLAVTALQEARDAGVTESAVETAIKNGLGWLTKFSKKDGTIDPGPDGFEYPIYTASLCVKALSHPTAHQFLAARDGWVKFIKERQLTENLGWKRGDKQYGGWGYCRVVPKKPEPNTFAPPLIESNLSATLFALDALHTAGELDEATTKATMRFVRRCQNADGGFHFIYDDPTRNKAGMVAGTPPTFHSYGSTTADGLRLLSWCTPVNEVGRLTAANDWLFKHFRADTHPGTYVPAHEPNREAVYYYYAASVARVFRDMKLTLPGDRDWAAELSRELAKRQRDDGSWANPVELVRENDPVVATCNAVATLARCKQ